MQFNVSQLLKEQIGSSRRYTINDTFEDLANTGTDRVWGSVVMIRTDHSIWVTGTLEATDSSTCSRCLVLSPHEVRFHVDEEYIPTVNILTDASLDVPEAGDGVFTIDEHHILDLSEAVRQYTITSLPMKPLCKRDCRGICQRCGANLNERECRCVDTVGDPRWTPLRELLSQETAQSR